MAAAKSAITQAMGALTKELKATPRPVDRDATEVREAVTAAVRGASAKVPADTPPDYGRMSNYDFNKSVREKYGFDPGP